MREPKSPEHPSGTPSNTPRRALPPTDDPSIRQGAVVTRGHHPAGPSATGARNADPQRASRLAFRGAVTRTIAGTIVPGLGLVGTRRHKLGIAVLVFVLAAGVAAVVMALRFPTLILHQFLDVGFLIGASIVLALVALAWGLVILGTYLVSKPRLITASQRRIGAALVGLLCAIVMIPTAIASGYAYETARLSGSIFGSEKDAPSQTRPSINRTDPWKNIPRVNILLTGGDSGEGRDVGLGIRTDTIMIASIDTATGNTVIIQIPRNLEHPPFPDGSKLSELYPNGFNDGGPSFVNSIWHDVPLTYPDYFTDTAFPGADALKWGLQGVTGLKIDYFVMINIDGLVQLVNAMGGVRVNVNYPIAKAGSDEGLDCGRDGWILEGPNQKLNGVDAMWFARSRCNSPGGDFGRMVRQSCLVNAIIDQADPAVMATRYEQIAKAAGNMIMTDIPQEHLQALIDLSARVKKGKVSRLTFVNGEDGFYSSYPDWELIHDRVQAAIQASAPTPNPTPAPGSVSKPTGSATTGVPATAGGPATAAAPATTAGGPVSMAPEASQATTQSNRPASNPQAGRNMPPSAPNTTVPAENVSDACSYRHEEPAWVDPSVPRITPPPSTPASDRSPR